MGLFPVVFIENSYMKEAACLESIVNIGYEI